MTAPRQHLALVTGPAGSGRTTALKAFEDIGFEAIDNMPAALVPRLLSEPLARPLALSLDARNRDFSAQTLLDLVSLCRNMPDLDVDLVYLDCPHSTLIRRFSETRRRHPLLPDAPVRDGIALEEQVLAPLRQIADMLIDTASMSPHDLRADIHRRFATVAADQDLAVQIMSFSYKRGLPEGADMVFDCRFLRNPHWDDDLRSLDGRSRHVAEYIAQDPAFDPFYTQMHALVESLLPSFKAEGKVHLCIALGCTGGRHRSVALAEKLAEALASSPWRVSKRHRELERIASGEPEA